MLAAAGGQEACVQTLLRAKADTELLDKDGHTPSCSAHCRAHTATAEFIRQHAACLSLVRGGVAREAERVAAASKARGAAKEAAATAAAAAEAAAVAEAEADALERATVSGGEGGSSGAAGLSEASEVAVPDQYMCSITSEIMIDPSLPACLAYTPLPFDATSLHRAHPLRSTHYRRKQVDGFTYERSATEQWLETITPRPRRASSCRASSSTLTTLPAASSNTS